MNLLSFILPNWNEALLVAIVLAVFGGIIVWASSMIPIKTIRNKIMSIGILMILGGAGYWIIMSFFEDILADKKVLYSIIAIASVIITGAIIFFPEGKGASAGKRKTRSKKKKR